MYVSDLRFCVSSLFDIGKEKKGREQRCTLLIMEVAVADINYRLSFSERERCMCEIPQYTTIRVTQIAIDRAPVGHWYRPKTPHFSTMFERGPQCKIWAHHFFMKYILYTCIYELIHRENFCFYSGKTHTRTVCSLNHSLHIDCHTIPTTNCT